MRAVLYCTNIVSRGIHRRAMSWWPSGLENPDEDQGGRALVVFMMAAKWLSLSLSLWYPLAYLTWCFHRSELNNLDQSITGDQNQTLWISVLLNHTLHCNALKPMLSIVFFSQIQLYKKIRNPPNLTDVWILDKIQYSLVTTLQCKGKLHFSQV